MIVQGVSSCASAVLSPTQLKSQARLYMQELMAFISTGMHAQDLADLMGVNRPSRHDAEGYEYFVMNVIDDPQAFKLLLKKLQASNANELYRMISLSNVPNNNALELYKRYFLAPSTPLSFFSSPQFSSRRDVFEEEEEAEKENVEEIAEKAQGRGDSDDELQETEETERGRNCVSVVDRMAAALEPQVFVKSQHMRRIAGVHEILSKIRDPLKTPNTSHIYNRRPWARAILRQFPYLPYSPKDLEDPFPSAIFSFAEALNENEYNRVALLHFIPNFEDLKRERDALNAARYKPRGDKLEDLVQGDVAPPCRPAEAWAQHRPQGHSYLAADCEEISLRPYQHELVEKAETGANCVVVAPTGSGKTVVAAHIARTHVMRRRAAGNPFRIVMVVPKIILVEQQAKQLYPYLKDKCFVEGLHGEYDVGGDRKAAFLSAHLIVMTPQILINLLGSIRVSERIYVSDITLLLLDECHHTYTRGNTEHPYAQLMKMVNAFPEEKRPQVVGLTASMGVGTGNDQRVESALEHVSGLMASMGVHSLSTVVRQKDNLEEHVQLPTDEIFKCSYVETELCKKMRDLIYDKGAVNQLWRQLKALAKPNKYNFLLNKTLVDSVPSILASVPFSARLDNIRRDLSRLADNDARIDLYYLLDIAKAYCTFFSAIQLVPEMVAFNELSYTMQWMRRSRPLSLYTPFLDAFIERENDLNRLASGEQEQDILRELTRRLSQQFEKNGNSRVIVFVSTRELTKHVSNFINDSPVVNRSAGILISSKVQPCIGFMPVNQTPQEQRHNLECFRHGSLPILVSTTVAEEGLDVSQCNLIIKYNMTGNVIALAQQRGRARAKDSHSVLLYVSETVKDKELKNVQAEKMMNAVVKRMHAEGERTLRSRVQKMADALQKEENARREAAENIKRNLITKSYEISCGECSSELCFSSSIRSVCSSYVCTDGTIWQKCVIHDADFKSKYVDSVTVVAARLKCINERCGKDLGKVIRYNGTYLPSFTAANLNFLDTTQAGEELTLRDKTWKKLKERFYIPVLEEFDERAMLTALPDEMKTRLEAAYRGVMEKAARDARRKRRRAEEEDEER